MTVATYHNHTTWSDGCATVAELVEHARALGVDELGISDHFVLHPSGERLPWGMPLDGLGDYVEEIRSAADGKTPIVRLGLEVDWFPGHGDALRDVLAGIPFDFLIGSVHEVDGFRVDASPAVWDQLAVDEQNEQHRRYWAALRSLAESGLFDVAAHIDLPKKFGHRPTVDLSDGIDAAIDAIGRAGMVVELNTAGWHKPCGDGYPSLDLLKRCRERGAPTTLSADAHDPRHLLRDFSRGADQLRAAGYTEIARFRERAVWFERL